MTTFEMIALAVVLLGLGAGAFLVVQRPAFWIGMVVSIGKMLWPLLLKTFAEDFGPENTKRVQEETRRNETRPPKWGHGGEGK